MIIIIKYIGRINLTKSTSNTFSGTKRDCINSDTSYLKGFTMEATFILALLSHGYKVRASTLYHLLKGKRTSSVLIYGFI